MPAAARSTPLPLPPFFDPAHAERADYAPDVGALLVAAHDWRRAHAVRPAGADGREVHLVVIDPQRDFCFPGGSLFVAGRSGRGALDDNRRIAELVYRNLDTVTLVTATLDTHLAFQIFFPAFWEGPDGAPLQPFREMTTDDLDSGAARPRADLAAWLCGGDVAWLRAQVRHYCAELERGGQYRLYLWPPHCLVGSPGHTVAGVVQEARLFHAFVRGAQGGSEPKGSHPLTENYSVLRPEVLSRHDGGALAEPNGPFLESLLRADAVVVAGQAASHCVRSSVDDLLDAMASRDRALARKVYVVTDCMSAVTVPDGRGGWAADFTPQAEAAQARWAEAGAHLVTSDVPMEHWPEFPARR